MLLVINELVAQVSEKDVNILPDWEVKQWLLSISNGDQSAYKRLLKLYWNKVYTQALTYLKSRELAQEITQDVFLKIWALKEKLPTIENFSSYLFILSRNEVVSALRKKKQYILDQSSPVEELVLRPDKQLHFKELHHEILNLIEGLPPVRKQVFKMSRLEGKSYEEIGTELGISRNGVKDHVVKALNYLRTNLGDGHLLVFILFLMFASH